MAPATKTPKLKLDRAIFIDMPPHLLLGHTKFNIKKNQPTNITTVLEFIFYFFIYTNISFSFDMAWGFPMFLIHIYIYDIF